MAAVVPVIGAIAGGAAASALGGGILGSLAGFVVNTAISQIGGRALSKKPKAPAFTTEASGRTTVIRSSVESHKVIYGQVKVSGPIVFVSTASNGNDNLGNFAGGTNKLLHMVIPLAGHEVEEIGTVYLNDTPLTLDGNGWATNAPYASGAKSYVMVRKHLGGADQTADEMLTGELPEQWSTAHRLRGIAYVYLRMEYNADVFPLGIPNVSAVVKGKKVYDPRTTLTAWSNNPALCIRDYLASDYGFNCTSAEINDTYFSAAANVCEESVTISTGGTHARYTCDGVIDTATSPLDNLGQLVTAVAGAVTYVQGKFRLHAGAYDAPDLDIPYSLLAGNVKGDLRTARKELFNAVKGTYVDPNRQWQPTDFPPVTNSTYETQDNGERIYKDLELPFTTDPERAQRIAKIVLEKSRQGIIIELSLKHHAMQLSVFDTVTVTNPQVGWDAKVFRVLKWSSTGTGPVGVVLQEESSASYDWNSGEATTIDPAPDSNLPNPLDVDPPGTPLVEEVLYVTTDGSGVKAKAVVTWPASPDGFIRDYQLEYKLSTATDYTVIPRIASNAYDILDIAPGTYQFRVKALSTLGVSSDYSTVAIKSLFGLTAAPGDVQNFSLNAINGAAHLSWDQATDIDVRVGGTVRIRYTPTLTGATWNSSIDIGPALSGISTSAVLPLLVGTYLAKFVDSTGNASPAPALIETDAANLIGLNLVETVEESSTFAGDKDGVVYDEDLGGIKLAGVTAWDSYPGDIDDWPMIDGLGGTAPQGTYDFANVIDLGAVYPCRLTAALTASGYDVGNLFDARSGDIDEWGDFDGTGETDFTDSGYWQQTGLDGVTADATAAPDGTITADRIVEDADTNEHRLHIRGIDIPNIDTAGSAEDVTQEVYVRPFGRDLRIMHKTNASEMYVDFDLAAGEIEFTDVSGTGTLVDYGITPASNGFFRCWVTTNANGSSINQLRLYLLGSAFADAYTGDGVSGVSLWGHKLYYGPLQPESAADDANAEIYLRTTNDDPALENWSEPRRFFVGDYTARAYWPQLRLTSADPDQNALVTQASLTVDMPERTESARNVSSGAGTKSITYTNSFREPPFIGITAIALSTGDYYEITNETVDGFDITFKNAGGTAVSRTFHWDATGYGKKVT